MGRRGKQRNGDLGVRYKKNNDYQMSRISGKEKMRRMIRINEYKHSQNKG